MPTIRSWRSSRRRPAARSLTAALAALAALCTACGGAAADRAGGTAAAARRVLTFADQGDVPPAALSAWAARVRSMSGGTLEIQFKQEWRKGEADYETATVGDVRAGKADLAWVGARALDRVGVTSFQALLAPMLVDSQALQEKVFEAGIPTEMLGQVQQGAGVVGVGVFPGPLRKVLGMARPFRRPADFAGATVGMQDSALTELTIRTLGATAKKEPTGASLTGLDGYEQQMGSIAGNGYAEKGAKYVTGNLDLWPRPLVVVAGQTVFSSLTPAQQAALRDAVRPVLPAAFEAARNDDGAASASKICAGGASLVQASPADLDALGAALEPVYAHLATDARSSAWLGRIRTLKQQVNTPPDTQSCPGATTAAASSPIDGTWQKRLTTAEDDATCTNDASKAYVTYRMVLRNGTARIFVSADGAPEQLGFDGKFTVFKDRATIGDAEGDFTARWTLAGDRLTLSDMTPHDCAGLIVFTLHPWQRVE